MTSFTIFIFIVFFLVLVIFGIISVVLFYHIGRYSYLGDSSKKIFSVYSFFGTAAALASFILLILNHLFS
jgi:hypothetical protein